MMRDCTETRIFRNKDRVHQESFPFKVSDSAPVISRARGCVEKKAASS
jgi:hypothetical protein